MSASWILRAQDRNNYYLIEINGQGHPVRAKRDTISFLVCRNGTLQEKSQLSLPFSIPKDSKGLEAWIEIDLKARGNQMDLIARGMILRKYNKDQVTIGIFTDESNLFADGLLGFRASGSEEFDVAELIIQPIQ